MLGIRKVRSGRLEEDIWERRMDVVLTFVFTNNRLLKFDGP